MDELRFQSGNTGASGPPEAGLSILYLGSADGSSLDRANAYRRLGHAVEHIDLRTLLPRTGWVERVTRRIGGHVFAPIATLRLRLLLNGKRYDVCHVNTGEWVTPDMIRLLREHTATVINYINDDPFSRRDRKQFAAYKAAIPYYDVVFVVRQVNVDEAHQCGASKVRRVYMSADEIAHWPRPLTPQDVERWSSDVSFVGTWMPERGPFLLKLAHLGVPLSIRGNSWEKAREWPELARYWKGPGVVGDDYAKAIQCSRISLGLLSKGNRDRHTTRSLEIPMLGGLLCAERTDDHQSMYREGEEAVFWSTPEECAELCRSLLADAALRRSIAERGRARVLSSEHLNERVMGRLLEAAGFYPTQALTKGEAPDADGRTL